MTREVLMQVFGLTFKRLESRCSGRNAWQTTWASCEEACPGYLYVSGPPDKELWYHLSKSSPLEGLPTPEEALVAHCLEENLRPPGFPWGEPVLGGLAMKVGSLYYWPDGDLGMIVLEQQGGYQIGYTYRSPDPDLYSTLEEALGVLFGRAHANMRGIAVDCQLELAAHLAGIRKYEAIQHKVEGLIEQLATYRQAGERASTP